MIRQILVGFLACVAAITAAGAAPLLDNGGFEQGEPPAGWRLPPVVGSVPRSVFSVDRAIAVEGTRSLRFANHSPDHAGPWSISRTVVIPAGRSLRLSGSFQPSGFKGSLEALVLATDPYTGILQPIGRATLLSGESGMAATGWRPFSLMTARSPWGGMGTVQFIFHGTGQVWLDALALEPVGPPPSMPNPRPGHPDPQPPVAPGTENLLADPGFEDPGSGSPWRKFLNPRQARGVILALDSGNAYSGARSAVVSNRSVSSREPAGWMQEVAPPRVGTPLRLTGYIRTENVLGSAYLRLECWGAPPTYSGDAARRQERLLASATSEVSWISGTEPWTPVSAGLVVPPGTTRVVVRCVLEGRGTAWFDEVRLLGTARPDTGEMR